MDLPHTGALVNAACIRGQSRTFNSKTSAIVTVCVLHGGDFTGVASKDDVFSLQDQMRAHVRRETAHVKISDTTYSPTDNPEKDARRPSVVVFHPTHWNRASSYAILYRSNASALLARSIHPVRTDIKAAAWTRLLGAAWNDHLAGELEWGGATPQSKDGKHWHQVAHPTAVLLTTAPGEIDAARAAARQFMLDNASPGSTVAMHSTPLPAEAVHRVLFAPK